ncbi:hypothetical protein BDN72DRAFT_893727 [Pluteus cervinus]|uniref:Uncharacterized protein n=1 Tax=Pluteus cervinus TaxID=181527 RepID=A0ACD3B863_9AGAR|nr:hypothetical protein BDN72DRAFT_893727 [Pluteus cervinus]
MSTPATSSNTPLAKPYGDISQSQQPGQTKRARESESAAAHPCATCGCNCSGTTRAVEGGKPGKRPRLFSERAAMGGDEAKDAIQTFTTIHDLLEAANAEETIHIQKEVKTLLESLKHISQLKEEHPNDDIKAISFSNLKKKDYLRLGVAPPIVAEADVAHLFVAAKLADGVTIRPGVVLDLNVIEPFWNQHYPEMLKTIQRVRKDTGNSPEAQARIVIDQYALTNMELLENRAIALFFTELTLSRGDNGPAEIMFRKPGGTLHRTFVTGRADYLFLISLLDPNRGNAYKIEIQRQGRDASLTLLTLQKLLKGSRADLRDSNTMRMIIMEAKKEGEGFSLADHMPQVVGECISIMTTVRQACVAWCLTTGEAWVFGITRTLVPGTHPAGHLYDVYATETMWVKYDGPQADTEDQMKKVFSSLAYWVGSPVSL